MRAVFAASTRALYFNIQASGLGASSRHSDGNPLLVGGTPKDFVGQVKSEERSVRAGEPGAATAAKRRAAAVL